MNGFSTTLNRFCAGDASLEAVLASLQREPHNREALARQTMLIESAWRGRNLDRSSYERLRDAVRAKNSDDGRLQDHGSQPSQAYDAPVFPSWGPLTSREPAIEAVRAHRDSPDGTMLRPDERATSHARRSDVPVQRPRSESTPASEADRLTHPSQWPHGPPRSVGPGSILKERFILEEIIGRGGMGTIFRAKDLRKEEAQDRHPYVAVKILNEDFRSHPESLKALQRESRKSQSLAHPNVASVFDFDRDGPLVYLVMELLEGVSLDRLIKSRVGRGLPRSEALRITAGLCAALAHAHQKGVVHSDFKPANAFRTSDGSVKVLDFGIARAVGRRTKGGEQTMFDPASLGALTPCYASPEMLVGEPPDPRDDVYALACVTYELFCSRHPFDFTSSLLAERRGMKPAPIAGLDRRVWRGLLHGLAFDRASRTPSVEAFLAEVTPPRRFWVTAAVAAGIAAVALGAVSWQLLPEYVQERDHGRYVMQLRSGDPEVVDALLPELHELPVSKLRALLSDRVTRDALIDHFERKVLFAIDDAQGRIGFDEANRHLDEMDTLMPDSSRVTALRAAVANRKQSVVARYTRELSQQVERGWLTEAQNRDNVVRTVAILQQIEPDWQPDRNALVSAFAAQVRKAIAVGDTALATQLLTAANGIAPGVAELSSLETALNQRVAEARERIQPAPVQPPVAASVSAPSTAESTVDVPAKPAATTSPTPQVANAPVPKRASSLSIAQRQQRVLALAAVNDIPELLSMFRELQNELPPDDQFIAVEGPDAIAHSYLRLAQRAFDTGEFETASSLLARAAEFAPEMPSLAERRQAVDRLGQLSHTLENALSISAEPIKMELEQIRATEGANYLLIRSQLAETLARRITELQPTAPQRANELLAVGKQIFAGSVALEHLQPVDDRQTAAQAREPSDAERAEAALSLQLDAEASRRE